MNVLLETEPQAASALDGLVEACGVANEVDLAALSAPELAAWVCGLQRVQAALDALVCKAAAGAQAANVAAMVDLFSVASFVAAGTGCDPKSVRADLRLGEWLRIHSVVAEALAAGRLTRRHVEVLAAATNPRTAADMVEWQDRFVDAAQTCGWKEFVQVVEYWRLAADPDGKEPEVQVASRKVSSRRRDDDGMYEGRWLLDPAAGQLVDNALDQEVQRLLDSDAESGRVRTHAQRRADALVELIRRGAQHATSGPVPVLIQIVMSHKVAEHMLRRLDGDPEATLAARLPIDALDLDGRCEFVDGTPVHPRVATALLAVAELRRVVLGTNGEILDLGRSARCFPRHLKDALKARARGRCEAVPGCDAPTSWLQADHIIPWALDGRTDIANGQMACPGHNRKKSNHPPQPNDN